MRNSDEAQEEARLFRPIERAMDLLGMRSYSAAKKSTIQIIMYIISRVIIAEVCYEAYLNRWLYMFIHWKHIAHKDLPMVIFMLMTAILSSVHLCNFYANADEIRGLMKSIERINARYSAGNAYRRAVVEKATRVTDFISKVTVPSAFVFTIGTWALLFPTFASVEKKMEHGYYFPYDTSTSPAYELSIMYATLIWALFLPVFDIIQVITFVILIHVICQFEVLHHELLNIRVDSIEYVKSKCRPLKPIRVYVIGYKHRTFIPATLYEDIGEFSGRDDQDDMKREMQKRLVDCVKHHQNLLRLLENLVSAIEPNLLSGIIYYLVGSAMAVAHIATMPHIESFTWVILLILAVGTIFFGVYGWMADKITEKSEAVREAVYGCDWFEASESFKRSMRIMMSMANQPAGIKLAGFIPLTMQTFQSVIQTSYGYYTVLSSFVDPATQDKG